MSDRFKKYKAKLNAVGKADKKWKRNPDENSVFTVMRVHSKYNGVLGATPYKRADLFAKVESGSVVLRKHCLILVDGTWKNYNEYHECLF